MIETILEVLSFKSWGLLIWTGPDSEYLLIKLSEATGLIVAQFDIDERSDFWIEMAELENLWNNTIEINTDNPQKQSKIVQTPQSQAAYNQIIQYYMSLLAPVLPKMGINHTNLMKI